MFVPQNFIMAIETNWVEKFVISAFDLFKSALEKVFDLLSANPTAGKGGYSSAWSVVSDLYSTFSVIGYSLVVLFFLYGFLRDTVDIRQELHLESIIKLFIRFIITINIMNVFITYIPEFCKWAIGLLGVNKGKFTFDSTKIVKNLSKNLDSDIVLCLLGILLWIVCMVCSLIVIYTCFGRFINFYLLIPFGSIALSTIAGGGQLSQTGFSYIKNLLVYTFEIVAMGVVLAIAGAFLSGSVLGKSDSNWWIALESLIKIITVTAALKGADSTIRKAFNM